MTKYNKVNPLRSLKMATLQSPGVSVSVIDESFYTPAGAGTVPMIFVATEQDKMNGSGTGTAQGTTAANAGKVWVITSQRDLADTFGTPYFETDAEGNPVHAGELNEYGLQAAYSALGVSSKAYIVRADVNTAELIPSASVPGGTPVNGTYWVNTGDTKFGIEEWNATSRKFTVKTPLIIDNNNFNSDFDADGGYPSSLFGSVGSYAFVITSDNDYNYAQGLYYRASGGWTYVEDGFDSGKKVRLSPHYDYPDYTSTGLNAATGSIWIKTTSPAGGANWDVKVYSSTSGTWNKVNAPVFTSTNAAIAGLDSVGGGANIPLGSVFVEADPDQGYGADFRLQIRYKSAPTTITVASAATLSSSSAFNIRETLADGTYGSPVSISLGGSGSTPLGQTIAAAINNASGLVNVTATWDGTLHRLTITHALGGDFEIEQTSQQPFITIGLIGDGSVANFYTAPGNSSYDYVASNWKPLVYEAQNTAPTTLPDDAQLWFGNNLDADILYNTGLVWEGYKTAFSSTDPLGPTVDATMPTTQQDGVTALVNGDIWIDTSMPDQYGKNIYVYDGSNWILQDVTDHVTPNGWVFADARWSTNGADDMHVVTSIADLLVSNYVDPDCPDPRLYPRGTRLFNTRRSGNNVKKYHKGYIDTTGVNPRQSNASMSSYAPDRWVTASPNDENNVGTFGRLAQRSVVVKSLKAMVTANTDIRDTDTLNFNIIACPGYQELMQDMVAFNTDIGLTAIVLGDTPFRLPATGTALNNYGFNTANSVDNNDISAVTYDTGLAMFYPSGYTNDNLGNNIVVPPSHMMIRTLINNDNKSYLWFAPAGTRRGVIDNVSSVGYVDGQTGEFKTASLHQGLRDVLQTTGININPIATLPGVGIVNMGQKTRAHAASALDRINVSRLVAYLRRQLSVLAKPFLFEPNDSQTRHEVKAAVDSLLTELVHQRALYDFLVVCDNSNNTPARIDRSELWIDIAIEPVKAVEFIYIPLRILNTGAIKALSK